MELKEKTAVVTGAGRGIGRDIALALAGEGCRVVAVSRTEKEIAGVEKTIIGNGGKALKVAADISRKADRERVITAALGKFGSLDILINNAGVTGGELLALLPDEDLDRIISTNILGLVRMSRAAVRPMLEQHSGCIINLSSVLATKPGRGNTVYAGTKGFVESFTRALAVELGKKNIRVNAVAPGIIETEMSGEVRALAGATLLERIALKRFGRPEDVASLVAFLASEDAAYINGAVLPVDGAFGAP